MRNSITLRKTISRKPFSLFAESKNNLCSIQFEKFRRLSKILQLLIIFHLVIGYSNKGITQAVTPCSCSTYMIIGSTTTTTNYRDVGPFSNSRCYFIKGVLEINELEAEWINLRIKMEEGSQIHVLTGLQLIGTYISGCGDMWRGIKTEEYANLGLTRSTIEDAEFGISLENFTSFHCEKSNFINDYIGIASGSPFGPDVIKRQILQRGQIYGCKFYTSSTLPDPYPGQLGFYPAQYYYPDWPTTPAEIPYDMGYAAVYLSGTQGIEFGFVGAESSDRNEIYLMRNGVILRYSGMNVAGTDLHDLEGDRPRTISSPQRDLNQYGINGFFSFSDIEDNTMESLMDGAWMAQSANTIKDNTFDILNSGVAVSRTQGIYSLRPQKLSVINNDVTNGYHGIHVTLANIGFEIKDNNLDRQGLPWLNTGIDVRSTLLTLRREGLIQNNELYITDGDFSLGIYLNSARQLDIDDNNVYFLVDEGAGNAIRGIGAAGLAHSIIHRNNVDPDAEYQPSNASYGIELFNSNMNNVVCNDIENSRANIFVLGSNVETQLIGNNIINGDNGLALYREVNMGTQLHNANLWLGNPDNCGAIIFVEGEQPTTIADHNRFIINDVYDNADFRPNPICPEEVESNEWFISENDLINENPNEPCNNFPDPYPIVDTLVHRIRTALDFEEYNDQMEWMEKADIFEYMLIDPSLHSNTVLDSFFDAEESNPLGILINAQFQLSSRFKTVIADKNDVLDTIQIFSDSLVYIDSILSLSPIDSATWIALRELKVDSLTESFERWQDLLSDEEDESYDTYDNIRNVLKFLSTGNDLEAYLREALIIRCQYLLGEGLDATDSANIYDLARLCPWEGGRAIPIAHELYTIVADSTLLPVTDCPPPTPRPLEERSEINSDASGLAVNPNPTNGVILITSDEIMQEIWIANSDGKTVLRLNPFSNKSSVYLNNEPGGLYLITIKYQGHMEHKTILLVK
jgi:hypothetical protein